MLEMRSLGPDPQIVLPFMSLQTDTRKTWADTGPLVNKHTNEISDFLPDEKLLLCLCVKV